MSPLAQEDIVPQPVSSNASDELHDLDLEKRDEKADFDNDDKTVIDVVPAKERLTAAEEKEARHDLELTGDDMLELESRLSTMSLERTRAIMKQVKKLHYNDQNFPQHILEQIDVFLADDRIIDNPREYQDLIREMKLEALLVTENSPYAEVRAVVENTDDPSMPSFTIRVWFIGIIYSGIGAAINQLFSLRQPSITITSEVAQLLAYPAGKLLERILPDKGFTMFGARHSLNPGPFNKKEHMLITIMATVAFNTPYTGDVVTALYLPIYYNQPWAGSFAFSILSCLGLNFTGYGLSGIVRRFLVYPSYCVWPASLVTLALNRAFHDETALGADVPVPGPLNKLYTWTRMKFFWVMFAAMFIWFWFPGYIFTALSAFSWISWIAPYNVTLANITSFNTGLGFNPWPTFDFNVVCGWIQGSYNPLVIPAFTTINIAVGMLLSALVTIGVYWTNTWNTSYLAINSNHIFDHQGKAFQVANVIDERALFNYEKYQSYSMPWMSAGNLVVYFFFFAQYTSAFTYSYLFNRHELALGFRGAWKAIKRRKGDPVEEDELNDDVHQRLMRAYKEVPEWWYMIMLAFGATLGMIGVGIYPQDTNPGVVVFGIAMALIFILPCGLISAVTGMQVTMNVLAELIGGAIKPGAAISMNWFKSYGYVVTAQAIFFENDLKLAHYIKIPPRHTFIAQTVATLVSSFVCTGMLYFQLHGIDNVCTSEAIFGMSCPGVNTFFTASVFWGTIGPKRIFGSGPYKALLAGFPVGFLMSVGTYYGRKAFPRSRLMRNFHPAIVCFGALSMSPYNLSYIIPAVPLALISWVVVRSRYLAFWSKYNFVLAAAWTSGIAIAAIVIFFALELPGIELDWWGNNVNNIGCNGAACPRLPIPEKGYWGPDPGSYP